MRSWLQSQQQQKQTVHGVGSSLYLGNCSSSLPEHIILLISNTASLAALPAFHIMKQCGGALDGIGNWIELCAKVRAKAVQILG